MTESGATGDRGLVHLALLTAGIAAGDFGRFVNDTRYFRPSDFDERAAMPVLIAVLPELTEPNVIRAVAAHLTRPWARPHAFDALATAFRRWAPREQNAGWALGNALATAGTLARLDELLDLASDPTYGTARQMIVDSLYRYRKDPRVAALLRRLMVEPGVSMHAMSAFRRTVGNEKALPEIRHVYEQHPSGKIHDHAAQHVRRIERVLAKQATASPSASIGR